MKFKNEELWNSCVENNQDPYGGACIKVARRVMEILDEGQPFQAGDLINQADRESQAGGISGFMAGAVASMVSDCHERGEEFRTSWNEYWSPGETRAGTINPAILTIG
jgi:hypothetical protein